MKQNDITKQMIVSIHTKQTMSKIISIEGNIGSGKSTLVSILQESLPEFSKNTEIVFLLEPVDEWESIKDVNGNTMLEKFYADQEKYSFSFQMMAYISRLALLKKTVQEYPNAIIITERSLYTDKLVFAKMLYDSQMIEDVNYQIYLKWFDTFAEEFPINGVVYISSDPNVCKERIQKRSRTGEDGISLNYLKECNKYHDEMIEQNDNTLILDGNMDIKDVKDLWLTLICEFIFM